MGRLANRLLVGAALAVALTSLARPQTAASHRCGYDRRPVKTLEDQDRDLVNLIPVQSTVATLNGIHIHEIPYPNDRRIQPEEFTVYKLRARLIEVRRERDLDLHLIIGDLDKPNMRMIAEIPAPECAKGTSHEEDYRRARAVLANISQGEVIEIVGVGFFDFLHDAKGGATNGIELHPVLSVAAVHN